MIKGVFKFLGVEENARAVTSIVVIVGLFGTIFMFLASQVLPVFIPTFQSDGYGKGYRTGRREAVLNIQVNQLRSIMKSQEIARKVDEETNNMTTEEITADIEKNGYFRD